MFENLQDKLDRAFKVLKGQGSITEINVAETMKEIRKALLDADVNYKTAKTFTDDVKEKALGQNVLTSISPGQLLTKIMNDELTALMGGSVEDINLSQNPSVILIAGLNGAGKTTFTGKLANYLKTQKGKSHFWLLATYIVRLLSISWKFWPARSEFRYSQTGNLRILSGLQRQVSPRPKPMARTW
jgi:signal recognition particle GTPase